MANQADILISIFLRGAMDGLNVVFPYKDDQYYSARPTIAIKPPSQNDPTTAIDLDGYFGLHPALNELRAIWDQGALAFIHASGSPDPTHSHFDAQDFMERGTPGSKQIPSGWLGRHLQTSPWINSSPFRAVSIGTMLPLSLSGSVPALAVPSIPDFRLGGSSGNTPAIQNLGQVLKTLYTGDATLSQNATLTFEATQTLQKANLAQYKPGQGAAYPQDGFGQGLQQVAQLIKANLGLEVATLDVGGWDTHIQEGAADGQLARLLSTVAGGLAAFYQDLSSQFDHITVVAMSEFGRRVRENGNHGTDHGHGNVMLVLSKHLTSARVFGQWPGLNPDQLYGPGDLAVTTDYRQVLGELVQKRLANDRVTDVFPGFSSWKPLGIFKE